MTNQLARLDAGELTQWLNRLSQTVDRSLREPARSQSLETLRAGLDTHNHPTQLIQLAFLSDCLQIANLAITADGRTDIVELERVVDLVRVAASKYYVSLPVYESFGDTFEPGAPPPSLDEITRFFRTHRADTGPFGYRTDEWRGVELARGVEQATRNAGPLQEHERMLVRIMETVFAGRMTSAEQIVRRRLRDLFERPVVDPSRDPRAVAFCRNDGPEVFATVAHGAHFHERDPFDVESIHAEARRIFHQQLDRATTPESARRGQGRLMLVLGDSGAGKTHLLRALRAQVHGRRMGYVGYLQLSAEVEDYPRYVLRNLIDSLEKPYDAPALNESGLMYLSDGLVEGRDAITPDDLEQLRTTELTPTDLEPLIGKLTDHIVRSEGLEHLEVDLVHALLLLQRRDPALQRRVVRFLRGESLTNHDRQLLCGLGPRDKPEDALRTIRQLAAMMHELQLAALVIVVDQIEDVAPNGAQPARLQQAFDSMRAIADAIPSSVVVLSCLENLYELLRTQLSQSLLDRLERDVVRLVSQRQPDEIEQMLIRRLEYLYTFFDVAWRDDDPYFPFKPSQLDLKGFRTRDVLGKFREFHQACIQQHDIVATTPSGTTPTGTQGIVELPPGSDLDKRWYETLEATRDLPDEDEKLLALVADALRGGATEHDRTITVRPEKAANLLGQVLEGNGIARRYIAICDSAPQGGKLANQIAKLREAAKQSNASPVALRRGEIKFQPKSKAAQLIGELIADNGLVIALTESDLRVATAARKMTDAKPEGYLAWRRHKKPLGETSFVRNLLDLDRELGETPPEVESTRTPIKDPAIATSTTPITDRARPPSEPPIATGPILVETPDHVVRLGVTDSFRADPILLPLEDMKTHVAFLGSTGSGKTTAALSVAEQLLERGVSVVLVDRKGDLARYVDERWWNDEPIPALRERKRALRDKLDLALFTPGNANGRPLKLPLVPSFADAKPQEREQLSNYAAEALGGMMGYGRSAAHRAKASVLKCAISLLGEDTREITIDALLDTISRPDPEILNQVGSLQRYFGNLTEDLDTLRIQRGQFLAGEGEALDMASLLPIPGTARTRLTIINVASLTEVPMLQFWVSRLLIELSRLGRKRPSSTLQAAVFLDEADLYVPAMSSPPTKEPLFDLLRRSRSTGIGVLLATQNPGDFDYKARDNINTWLLGKIAQDRAIEKMKNLIGSYPDVGPRLASQRTGSFFVLTGTTKRELKADRSMMETVQLPDAEIAELAKATKPTP